MVLITDFNKKGASPFVRKVINFVFLIFKMAYFGLIVFAFIALILCFSFIVEFFKHAWGNG